MDLSRMKAEKDARDSQDLAIVRQRQSEQVRQNMLMREQAQRVATVPVRNLLPGLIQCLSFADCLSTITTTAEHISVTDSASATSPTTYTAATSASTCSNLAIAPTTSPTTSNSKSTDNWCPFDNTKSVCKVVYICQRSTIKSTGATCSARARSPSFSSITSGCTSSKYGQFAHSRDLSDYLQQNLLAQPQSNGNTYYGLPSNLTQEQVDIFHVQLLVS